MDCVKSKIIDMKRVLLLASFAVSTAVMAQSVTITGPDDQEVKMEMDGFQDSWGEEENASEANEESKKETQAAWAKVEGNTILLPDGRSFVWSYSDIDGLVGCEIEMKAPMGASVELSYENKIAYSSEVPFFYREKAFQYFSSYIKLTVVETSGSAWMVKLQNQKNKKIIIDGESSGGSDWGGSAGQPTVVSGNGNCGTAMGSADYNLALESIKGKSFEDTKLDLAKQVVRANCMSSKQIAEVMRAMTFEDSRLEFAEFAYKYCVDPNQYYLVNDAFEFELTIEELQEFLDDQE